MRIYLKPLTILLLIFLGAFPIVQSLAAENHQRPSKSGYAAVEKGQLFYQRFGKGSPIMIIHGGPGLEHPYHPIPF